MSYEDKTTTTLDGRKATPEAQLELRRRCIVYFRDGVKRAEIARRLGLSRQWVTKIIKIYQTEGFDSAVAGKKRGLNEAAASEKRRLSREEEKKVANWIVDKNPAQLKFDFALWTAKAVRQLIYREFGRQLDLSTVRRYLRSWGMTPQRPKKKAIQQDDAAVQRWLETDYPAIAERAKKEKATIFGEDETAVQQDTNWIRGYAPRLLRRSRHDLGREQSGAVGFCFSAKRRAPVFIHTLPASSHQGLRRKGQKALRHLRQLQDSPRKAGRRLVRSS